MKTAPPLYLRLSFAVLLLALTGWTAPPAAADSAYTPARNSAERKALMDTLRPSIEREIGKKVVFKVNKLKVQNGWAFLYADPVKPDGSPVDYHGTKFEDAVKHGMFGGGVGALFHKRSGRWRVVTYVIGPTDVAWEDWDTRYHAPSSIFK